jgi:hypothetical protein
VSLPLLSKHRSRINYIVLRVLWEPIKPPINIGPKSPPKQIQAGFLTFGLVFADRHGMATVHQGKADFGMALSDVAFQVGPTPQQRVDPSTLCCDPPSLR